jgi:hypothetical protein
MHHSYYKLCVFGSHHKYQSESPINSFYAQHLRELMKDHQLDFIFEEATSLQVCRRNPASKFSLMVSVFVGTNIDFVLA